MYIKHAAAHVGHVVCAAVCAAVQAAAVVVARGLRLVYRVSGYNSTVVVQCLLCNSCIRTAVCAYAELSLGVHQHSLCAYAELIHLSQQIVWGGSLFWEVCEHTFVAATCMTHSAIQEPVHLCILTLGSGIA
eukprot:1588-Heterococcus_DN1.PRE.7